MKNVRCPICYKECVCVSPNYGRGAEYKCYNCDSYGRRFTPTAHDYDHRTTEERESLDERNRPAFY